jgi:hypothetical protein
MANGNGMTIMTAKVILGIAQAVLILLVTGIGGLLLKQRDTLIEVKTRVEALESSVLYRLDRVENTLDNHITRNGGG